MSDLVVPSASGQVSDAEPFVVNGICKDTSGCGCVADASFVRSSGIARPFNLVRGFGWFRLTERSHTREQDTRWPELTINAEDVRNAG